jgi:biopolymer transport protein ExbB
LLSTEANKTEILRLEKQLEDQLQSMGDIASTFREFSGDFAAVMSESMVTAQIPGRSERMYQLGTIEAHPTIEQIQSLWLLLQEEMTESAKITKFDAAVVATDGSVSTMPVVRLGTFSTLSEAGFLRYVPVTGELLALSRQPAARYRTAASHFINSEADLATAVIDPTRGGLLGMMGYTPGLRERIDQGGPIARIILSLGALGALLTLWRTLSLSAVYLRVRQQIRDFDQPSKSNPLGRIMCAAANVPAETDDLLLMKIDEAILAEIPALERGTGLIKLLAATAPLLGLLGTVTGMIVTFQSISLFGTGDPKLMAGGISQALVTTVLGLVVAIPLLFGHNLVATISRSLIQRLDEQSAGMLARTIEQQEHS